MSEEVAAAPETADPVALSLALAGASRAKADAFLDDERHHLHEQERHMGLKLWELRMGVFLRVATLIVGIAVATAAGRMVWEAAHSNGLLIEPFSVPPDLAARGLTGQAVAARMLDKLITMQNGTESARPAQSYANNWGEDLKVEIPETGVSLGELRHFLRDWLGHDTHISGEVWRTADGIAMTARAGGDAGEIVSGKEAELDTVIEQVAENVYRVTQPYRYANYLDRNTYRQSATLRFAEAEKVYKRLVYDANPIERAWAWNGLGTLSWNAQGNIAKAVDYYHKAIATWPEFFVAWTALSIQEGLLGHAELSLSAAVNGGKFSTTRNGAQVSELTGDYAEFLRVNLAGIERPNGGTVNNHDTFQNNALFALAMLHDGGGYRAWLANMPPMEAQANIARGSTRRLAALIALQNWRGAADFEPQAESAFLTYAPNWDINVHFARQLRPLLALAHAKLGGIGGAESLISLSPLDCQPCLRIRAQIADMAGKPAEADGWFARAVRDAPSAPFAYQEWGRSLLARGKADAAIVQFQLSNQKGPHFADPLEGWGEALMGKNQSHRALAKFEEANKYAPNWGRLHLKWGEALLYAGKPAEAKAQFARAAGLDLTPSEKSEFARMNHV